MTSLVAILASPLGVAQSRNGVEAPMVVPTMDANIEKALERGGIVDVTTTGRRTGVPRRIEIYLHNFEGDLYLTGRPGFPRDWVANILADPSMTLHLKRGVTADIPVLGTVIGDPQTRADIILRARVESWGADPDQARAELDGWLDTAPLVRLEMS